MNTQRGTRKRRSVSELTKRILESAPALAERGLSKADAARELDLSPAVFRAYLHHRAPDIQWRDGRSRASRTVEDDERATMRRVMDETLAGTEQPPVHDDRGVGR